MSDAGDLDPQLVQQLDNFKSLFETITNSQTLDEMVMSITENYDNCVNSQNLDDFGIQMSNIVNVTKKRYTKDLKSLHNSLYKSFSFLLRSEDEDQKSLYLQSLYGWLRTFKISESTGNADDSQIKHYFEELSDVKESLREVKTLADEMADTNKALNHESSSYKQIIANLEENLNRKTNKCDKLAATIEKYRSDTVKLVCTVESELEKLRMLNSDEQGQRIDKLVNKVQRASKEFNRDDFDGLELSPMMSP